MSAVLSGCEPKPSTREARKQCAIDSWLDYMLRRYFVQKRAIWTGKAADGHVFGWSARSVMGRLKDEGDQGASHGTARDVHYFEVYTEDALLVRRAIEGCDHDAYTVGHLHYIVPVSVKVKAREAGYAPSSYYDHLAVFHTWTKGRIELLDVELSRQKIAESLARK